MLLFTHVPTAHAQRVYASEITGPGHVQYESETLIFMLSPDKIADLKTSEKQVHIQMTQASREYFYTLTRLNVGKKLIVKSGGGETIQEAVIRKPIDSGLIISRPIESRGDLSRFLQRIKTGREPIVIEPRTEYDMIEEYYKPNRKIYDTQEAKEEIVNQLENTLISKDAEILELRKQLLKLNDFEERIKNAPADVMIIDEPDNKNLSE